MAVEKKGHRRATNEVVTHGDPPFGRGVPLYASGMLWFEDEYIDETKGSTRRRLPYLYIHEDPATTLVTVSNGGKPLTATFDLMPARRLVRYFAEFPRINHGEHVLSRAARVGLYALPKLLSDTVHAIDALHPSGTLFQRKQPFKNEPDYYTHALQARVKPGRYMGK